ncbi:MAG: type VI secretion system baseplate subunit TssK [Janthinobacterium lividum]
MNPISRPLFWHQGLFLQPQHFQHTDLLNAQRLSRLTEITQPHCWGVASLQLDHQALHDNRLHAKRLSLRFRDGTLVEIPGNGLLAPRALTPRDMAQGARTVHVGIRRLAPNQAAATVVDTLDQAATVETRLATLAEAEAVQDYHHAGDQARLQPMYYVLRFFLDNELEQSGAYETIPLARVERGDDALRFAADFVPPLLLLDAAAGLKQALADLRDDVAGRVRQLKPVNVSPHGDALANLFETSQAATRRRAALMILNRFAPELAHWLELDNVHPWHLYGFLRRLAGELSLFSQRCDVLGRTTDGTPRIQAYRHDSPGEGFASLIALIGELLGEISFRPEAVLQLVARDELWLGDFPDSFRVGRQRFYLTVHSTHDAESLTAMLINEGKLAAPGEIVQRIAHAVPGAALHRLAGAPPGMPQRADALYFRIEQSSDAWRAVETERAVALFLPEAPADFAAQITVAKE